MCPRPVSRLGPGRTRPAGPRLSRPPPKAKKLYIYIYIYIYIERERGYKEASGQKNMPLLMFHLDMFTTSQVQALAGFLEFRF